jgi:DNA-binding transcriptional LysR family regulator
MEKMELLERIGQRLRLQDLRILMAVAHAGSMSKAAQSLNTTQPAISRSIAELEHTLGVRLLDRSRRGVEPTKYGRALLDGGAAIFDDLRQAVKSIEFLADPTVGEIRIGGNEAIIAGLLAAVYGRLRRRYPGIAIHVTQVAVVSQQYRELRDRKVDFILGRVSEPIDEDIAAEVLFYDRTFVVASPHSKWSRRRKIELLELAEEAWGLPPSGTLIASLVADAFRAKGMDVPRKGVATGSIHLLSALVASGPFLITLPGSVLRFGTNLPALKVLSVDLPVPPWPVGLMMLKDRTVSPVVQLFFEFAREVTKPLTR